MAEAVGAFMVRAVLITVAGVTRWFEPVMNRIPMEIAAALLTAFPKELVVAIAGLALLGTIGNGLASALRDESHREAALITFLVTLSGVAGVGSAFWGVVAGSAALFVQQYRRSPAGSV